MKQNESVKKLEVGKDYVNVHDNSVIVIDRVSDMINRGFEGEEYKKYFSCLNYKNWREATEQEVIEAFERHLIHRYGADWRTMKIKEKHPGSPFDINCGLWLAEIGKAKNGWEVWNKNGLLYRNGIWVERLEEEEEEINIKASETQIGGNHYSEMAIQPIEYIMANKLSFPVGNVVKYVSRYDKKNNSIDLQIQDLEKAKQNIDFIIEELKQ